MTQLAEAVGRYHKLLDGESYRDLAWAEQLQADMRAKVGTVAGRPISPVLRPHFLSRRQLSQTAKAAECLLSAVARVEQIALTNPALLTRMQLLPAEKMLATIDPGYSQVAVTALLDSNVQNGSVHFTQYQAENVAGLAYSDLLADLFYDSAPIVDLRRRFHVEKLTGTPHLVEAVLAAYREFGGKAKPQVGVLAFRQQFPTVASTELHLFADLFTRHGYPAEMVSPEQLEYRNGILRKGDFQINLLCRHVRMNEFLLRCDLNHPLVRAYRDRAVCVVNSFRAELAQKRALFHLLTDETVTSRFPLAERKAIREHLPWTRVVAASKTTYGEQSIDLLEFARLHRERLVLKPNDEDSEDSIVFGARTDAASWDKALRDALRSSYVVQEACPPPVEDFPVLQNGSLEMKSMQVDLHPHSFLGKVHGCSTWLTPVSKNAYSAPPMLTATFVVDR